MIKKTLLIIILLAPVSLLAQSLGKERVQRVKESIVALLINTSDDVSNKVYRGAGTAFFVNDDGYLATCYHVIENAIVYNNAGLKIGVRDIAIRTISGEVIPAEIELSFLNENRIEGLLYDCVLIKAKTLPKSKFSYLPLGNFGDIEEGDAIYTCGYPLGLPTHIVSTGILSTKFEELRKATSSSKPKTEVAQKVRNLAWLDLTMNRGNSGGPIIKLGSKPEDDYVIGIATFILNPYANEADNIANFIRLQNPNSDLMINGVKSGKTTMLLAEAVANNSIGISGVVSINHLKAILKWK
ncbi:S1 family peptidase [Runella rosea]|nr:serine protease [Runella rosea]